MSDVNASMASTASNVAVPNLIDESGIVPSTQILRQNALIQKQVDDRFLELQSNTVATSTGKIKSQRGGTEVIVKNFVAWPQNYMLLGPEKKRPTYDQLDPIHWMSGCLKSVADLSESDKPKYLQYLTELLQDAADFSFESAKACHAVVLTTIE